MFRIGEFSRIARVSGRLLRYYDSIGLLCPQRIDADGIPVLRHRDRFGLTRQVNKPVVLPDKVEMTMTELPAVETLATLVRRDPTYQSHLAFGALGLWMEANGYRITGRTREVFLELPFQAGEPDDTVMEIQFPVTKAA